VYLKGYAVRGPALCNSADFARAVSNKNLEAEFSQARLPDDSLIELARPCIPENMEIERRDRKILTDDLITAIDCATEATGEAIRDPADLEEVPLYIATGVVLDRILEGISPVLTQIIQNKNNPDSRAMAELVNETLPPLLGLRSLTSSINHFVSKYTGVRGESTTYGSTSNSSLSALSDGFYHVACGRGDFAVVGAVNEVGVIHSVTLHTVSNSQALSRESGASVFIVLGSKNTLDTDSAGLTPRISELGSYSCIAATGDGEFQQLSEHVPAHNDDMTMITNAVDPAGIADNVNHFSWQNQLGYLGVAGLLLNLATAGSMLQSGSIKSALCVDKDNFGREGWLRLSLDQ